MQSNKEVKKTEKIFGSIMRNDNHQSDQICLINISEHGLTKPVMTATSTCVTPDLTGSFIDVAGSFRYYRDMSPFPVMLHLAKNLFSVPVLLTFLWSAGTQKA